MSLLNLTPDPHTLVRPGTMCAQHGAVEAVAVCRVCGNGMCATCDFALPGDVHACPACIESSGSQGINPGRILRAWTAIVLAILTTLVLILSMTGILANMTGSDPASETFATVVGNLILWPGLAGIIFALTSFDRRLGNNGVIWTAVIWNAALVGIFVLLMIIGLAMG
jgi:hypothetical protein